MSPEARLATVCYLIGGLHVGDIAKDMSIDRAALRGLLKDGGITLKPSTHGYTLGRDSVCDAVKRAGFGSFHRFAQVKGMDPITEQAAELCVSAKSLTRVYNAYRRLLTAMKAAGIPLPTSQSDGNELERPTRDHPS